MKCRLMLMKVEAAGPRNTSNLGVGVNPEWVVSILMRGAGDIRAKRARNRLRNCRAAIFDNP